MSILFSASTLASRGDAAADGGASTGGGKSIVPLSSAKEVAAAIDDAKVFFLKAFTNDFVGLIGETGCLSGPGPIYAPFKINHEPRLLEMMAEITKGCRQATAGIKAIPIVEAMVAKTQILKKEKGACSTVGGAHTEASVDMENTNSPICFSIELLQRLPQTLLKAQVIGLMAHEFMHKFGYNEKDAVLVQRYFITELANRRALVRGQLAGSLNLAREAAQQALNDSLPKSDRERTCMFTKRMEGSLLESFTLVKVLSLAEFAKVPDETWQKIERVTEGMRGLENLRLSPSYCYGEMSDAEVKVELEKKAKSILEVQKLVPAIMPRQY